MTANTSVSINMLRLSFLTRLRLKQAGLLTLDAVAATPPVMLQSILGQDDGRYEELCVKIRRLGFQLPDDYLSDDKVPRRPGGPLPGVAVAAVRAALS